MTSPHIPNLEQLTTLQNQEVKFYAIIGAVVSLSASLELKLLDVFLKGMNTDRDQAIRVFYKAKTASLRRDIADTAMQSRLGSGPLLADWKKLLSKIMTITGQGGTRHLIAHNFVTKRTSPGFGFGFGTFGAGTFGQGPSEDFSVTQDQEQVLAGLRKPQQADFDALLNLCRDIITVLSELDVFLSRVP